MRNLVSLLIIAAGAVILMGGCDSPYAPINKTGNYSVLGSLVKNLDIDSVQSVCSAYKDLKKNAGISLFEGNHQFLFDTDDSLYYCSPDTLQSGSYFLRLEDTAGNFADSVSLAVPGNFAITDVSLQPGYINPGGDDVQLQWSTSLGAEGYILAVVKKDSAYIIDGYISAIEGAVTSGTIPLDAFRPGGKLEPDTGFYNVYIYSYTGSPASDRYLPAGLPDIFSNNIDGQYLTGSFGVVVVSPRIEIHVVVGK